MPTLRELEGEIRTVKNADGSSVPWVWFNCPVCGEHLVGVPFSEDGQRVAYGTGTSISWKREAGSTIDDLTLSPSILTRSGSCEVHGYVRDGHWVGC